MKQLNINMKNLSTNVHSLAQTPKKICAQIKSKQYPVQKMDITQFFVKLSDSNFSPKPSTRIQVRQFDRDIDRIERAVNKMKSTGDMSKLEPLVIVYFPKDNIYKLLNGNHTCEMGINLGIKEMNIHVVNFETQLQSKMSNAIRLGNLLNLQDVEKVDVKLEDIKRELLQIMDEREAQGIDPKPTDQDKKELVDLYPQVTLATIGQWISNHETVGSRRLPTKTYTEAELQAQRQAFENDLAYKDYVVLHPRTLAGWSDTGVSAIFNGMMEQGKKKALVLLYCSTVAQVDQLTNTDIRATIETRYKKLSEYYGVQINCVFMRYE
jgi:hypothetical protein